MMKQAVTDIFIRFTSHFEGHCLHPYLDVEGLVTIGYGNLIDPHIPAILDWRDLHGIPLTGYQVQVGWQAVKNMQDKKDLGGGVFRWFTDMRVTEASVNLLCQAELSQMYNGIQKRYLPDLDTWPADAQLALMSWAWADGEWAMPKWPKFHAACLAKDWATCALECHIDTTHNPGVVSRNAINWELFHFAESTTTPDTVTASVILELK